MSYDIEDEMEWSEHFYAADHGARGYKAMFFGEKGLRLYTYPYTGEHCHLEIPGSFLEGYNSALIISYLKSLMIEEFHSRASRIDVAFDNVPFTPIMCHEARFVAIYEQRQKKNLGNGMRTRKGRRFTWELEVQQECCGFIIEEGLHV